MRLFLRRLIPLTVIGVPLWANVVRVPADQPSIQAGINAAASGDTVLVAPGTYLENLDFLGKAITVTSEQGPAVTIVDGRALDSVVKFTSGEGRTSVLSGFTLQNGYSTFSSPGFADGGGIWIRNSSPTIQSNVIANNRACEGPGIYVSNGSPLIQANDIKSNSQAGCSGGIGGGGIALLGGPGAEIRGNIIEQNSLGSANGGGISMFGAGTPVIAGNVIRQNTATGLSPCTQGGGIWMVNQSDALVVNNLITGNTAGCGGGVYWGVPSGNRGPYVINNTIAGNFANQGEAVYATGYQTATQVINNILVSSSAAATLYCDPTYGAAPILNSNDVYTASGTAYAGTCASLAGANGNISADPLFIAPGSGDYHLSSISPAIDTGTSAQAPDTDLAASPRPQDGNGDGTAAFDMGVFEAPTRDLAPPVSTATPSPLPNAAGWNSSNVSISLVASDGSAGSGVKQIQYGFTGAQTGGPFYVPGNVASASITVEGTTTLGYNSVDNAGNAEVVKNLIVKLDRTAPAVAGMPTSGCTLSPAHHQMVQVATITASDPISGVASFNVSATSDQPDSGTGGGDVPGDILINGGTVQLRAEISPGTKTRTYTISANAIDFAGNLSAVTATCTVHK